MLNEVIVPLTEDITQAGTLGLNIIRDLEAALATAHDLPFASGEEFLEGEWGKVVDGKLESVTGAVAATDLLYPVWCGSGDRYDAVATGQVTVLTGVGYIYETSKYNKLGLYPAGTPLTIKNGKVPTPAGAGEPVIGRVFKDVAGGLLTIQVCREGTL
jgi:hypothetical protein